MSLDNSPQFCGQLIIEHPDLYAPIPIHNKETIRLIHTVSGFV